MVQISINDGQLFLDSKLIDLRHLVEQAEIHEGVLVVMLSTINMDREQMRCNIWGLSPVTGKVLWQIQNRLLPEQDPNVVDPDPFSGFRAWKAGYLTANSFYGRVYSLNPQNGTVEYLHYAG